MEADSERDHNAENQGGNPLPFLFSKTWQYSKGNRQMVACYWIFFIVANVVSFTLGPFIMAQIINTIQGEGITRENFNFLLMLLSVDIINTCIFWGFHGSARVIETCNGAKVEINYRRFLMKGIMGLPLTWHNERHTGNTVDKIKEGTDSLHHFSSTSFVIIGSAIKLIISVGVIIKFSLIAGIVVIVVMILACWMIARFDIKTLVSYRKQNKLENEIAASISDAVSNIMTIVTLRTEKLMYDRVSNKLQEPYPIIESCQKMIETKWFLVSLMCTIMSVAVMGTYFWQSITLKNGVLIGDVFLLFRYLRELENIFFTVASDYSEMLSHLSKVQNSEILTRDFVPEPVPISPLPKGWKEISIRGLNFSHKNAEGKESHLDNMSITFRPGERLALVGESGSGKSTLLNVMRGLYIPQSGELLIDGQLSQIGLAALSSSVGLVPQHTEIFNDTVRYNITLSDDIDDAVIRKFTDIACLSKVIDSLPKGLDSMMMEDGVNLSGGQKQRLVLVRALLFGRNMPLVMLDEPTASLDKANEKHVMLNVFKAFADSVVISSVHQLNLLPLFDRVIVFDKGKIVGEGKPDELLSTCPVFRELWSHYRHDYV